ncbi:MAG: NAD(P)-dependent alcohol dehydrogenase [Acidimicrobiia bacterium]|nr:MAG: NAD(P)-dependent alcohol dehydrogenase [Acidimicrobiia bacterium]
MLNTTQLTAEQESAMKAIVQYKYGSPDVLELREVDKPVVGDDDVLVRVRAASVNPFDWHMMRGRPYLARIQAGLLKPKQPIQGADMAGQVVAVGRNVTLFQPGDEVFGEYKRTFAEYVCVPEHGIAPKPTNLTFEQAAAIPLAGITALQGLRDKGQIRQGHKVLINGASGGVGTFAVQIAKSFGAEVTGVCSTRNVDMVRSIGADHVIDYTKENFTERDERYDLILDLVNSHSLSDYKRVMNRKGVYVLGGSAQMGDWVEPLTEVFKVLLASVVGSQKMVPLLAKIRNEDMIVLKELAEAEKVTPVIDRRYPLSEVQEALWYQGEGHAQGKTVITI